MDIGNKGSEEGSSLEQKGVEIAGWLGRGREGIGWVGG